MSLQGRLDVISSGPGEKPGLLTLAGLGAARFGVISGNGDADDPAKAAVVEACREARIDLLQGVRGDGDHGR